MERAESRGFGRMRRETAYPVYGAEVCGRPVQSAGIQRYDVGDLEGMMDTGESVALLYDCEEGTLWRLEEISARRRN